MSPNENVNLGRLGETLAAAYLDRAGWLIMDRNWRCRAGEIDIVAMEGSDLVICEVKTRATNRAGTALEAVTPRKLNRLHRLALEWLNDRGGHSSHIRVDVIGVEISRDGRHHIHHVRGAM